MTTLLVDGDIVVYRSGFAVDKTHYEVYIDNTSATPSFESTSMKDVRKWLAENNVSDYSISRTPAQGDVSAALAGARDTLYAMYERFKPDEVVVFLDGEGNFREDIATYKKYKGNRDHMRRPLFYNEIRDYLIKHHDGVLVEGHETDDELGLRADNQSIICSIDKDLKQVPGLHYNWVRDEIQTIDFFNGDLCLYKQCLTGDNSDNIVGIHGVGDKTALSILGKDPDSWWDRVVQAYRERFTKKLPDDMEYDGTYLVYPHWRTGETVRKTVEEYAEEVAQLVYIKRKDAEEWRTPQTIL